MMNLKILLSGIILGLLDGLFNPCTLSVIVFLVLYLLNLGVGRKRILYSGLAFSFGVALTYFVFMLSLLKIFEIFFVEYSGTIYTVLGILCIVFGIIEIKDFFWYGKGVSLIIPSKFREKFDRILGGATIISSMLLGMFVALAEIPCAGMFPVAYTSMVLSLNTKLLVQVLLLLWYIFFFALPLAMIAIGIYFGLSIKKVEEIYQKGRRWMRLVMGVVLVLLGLSFLLHPNMFLT